MSGCFFRFFETLWLFKNWDPLQMLNCLLTCTKTHAYPPKTPYSSGPTQNHRHPGHSCRPEEIGRTDVSRANCAELPCSKAVSACSMRSSEASDSSVPGDGHRVDHIDGRSTPSGSGNLGLPFHEA